MSSVNVSGIAPSTSTQQLQDFFTFCGKIKEIKHQEKSDKAEVIFEKASAAKTAVMLHGGTLDGATLSISSETAHHDDDHHHDSATPLQEDKPRAGIAAEYLAKGYQLSDQVLARAISLDHERGISKRFLDYVHQLDKKVGERALGPDQTVSGKVQSTVDQGRAQAEQKGYLARFQEYYTKALETPIGQRVRDFYTTTSKQIFDIHEEARRIADEEKKAKEGAVPMGSSTGTAAPAPAT